MLAFIRLSKINLLIYIVLSFQPLYSKEPPTPIAFLNLDDFSHLNGQLVAIRGFLYETPESLMVLAAEPDLKSCCVGSASKRQRQLLVTGNIDRAVAGGGAVTLQGNLVVAIGDDFPYRLEEGEIVAGEDRCYWALGAVGLGMVLLAAGAFFALRKAS
jgi:hypothetical protein